MEQKIAQLVAEIERVDSEWQDYYDKMEDNDYNETSEDENSRIVAEAYSDGLKTAYLIMVGEPYSDI
jgi:hypothetical protein